jgi:hypothetical protein
VTTPASEICLRADLGPTLLYVHTDDGTSTFVDKDVPTDPRERAICRALLLHALALLDASEPARATGMRADRPHT